MAGNAKPTFPRLRRSNPLVYGLLAGYTLHEGGGLIANDISGQGNNGTLSGATIPTWAELGGSGTGVVGSFGWGLTFDGATSYVDCGSFANNLSQLSVAAWVRVPAGGATNGVIVAKLTNLASGIGWAMYTSAGKIAGLIQQSGTIFSNPIGTTNISNGDWHHVAFTWDGTTCRAYADGKQDATDTMHGAFTGYSNASHVRIGTDQNLETFWASSIDDVWIWNRVLSQAEIAALREDTFQMVRGSRTIFSSAAPVVVTQEIAAPEVHAGPPMRGSPWLQQLPLTDGLRSTASVIAWMQTASDKGSGLAKFFTNVTSGSFLEATFLTLTPSGSPGPTLSVTDTLGQVYTQAGPYVSSSMAGGQVATLSKWYVPQTLGGPCSVNAIPSFPVIGGNAFGSAVLEYRVPAILSVDSTVQGDGTSSQPTVSVGPVLVTGTGADLVCVATSSNPFAITASVSSPFQFRGASDAALLIADDVSAYATETATFTIDRGVFSGPWLGVAYRFGTVPGQQQTKFEAFEGPPIRGAPWVVKLPPAEDAWTVQAPPPVVGPPPQDYELHAGPPIRGAPWQQHLPIEDALLVGIRFPPVPPAPPTPGKGRAKPFIERWPDVSDPRRLGRITDKISNMLNSLAGQALIQQQGPAKFIMRASAIQLARAPTAADDVTTGATVGTVWINTVTQQLWICVANAQGAAVWRGPI